MFYFNTYGINFARFRYEKVRCPCVDIGLPAARLQNRKMDPDRGRPLPPGFLDREAVSAATDRQPVNKIGLQSVQIRPVDGAEMRRPNRMQ